MTTSLETKRLFSVTEAAEYLECHHDTIRRHLKAGTIPHMKLGRVIRISRKVLDDLVDNQAKIPVPPRANNTAPVNKD